MDQIRAEFKYLGIPRINDAKIEEGVFVVPQITQLKHDIKFEDRRSDWKGSMQIIQKVTTNIFGKL